MPKILVLDDNADILEAVSMVLQRKQLDVVTIKDAEELNESLARYKPDLLLMDIALGQYDGRTLCRRLKNSALYHDMAIVLFTAQTYTEESIHNSGADAIIAKPFASRALLSVIDGLLV